MSAGQKRILCIDDDPDTCELFRYLFDFPGLEVVSVHTAAGALRRIKSEHFDLCLLDNRLPDASGTEVCRWIRDFTPQTPIIFISASAYETDIRAGIAAGASGYLTKPFELAEVKPVIEQTLGRG